MKVVNEARRLEGGAIEAKHEISQVCSNCGYDLDETELSLDTCSDCGQSLSIAQTVRIYVTSVPAAQGSALK